MGVRNVPEGSQAVLPSSRSPALGQPPPCGHSKYGLYQFFVPTLLYPLNIAPTCLGGGFDYQFCWRLREASMPTRSALTPGALAHRTCIQRLFQCLQLQRAHVGMD